MARKKQNPHLQPRTRAPSAASKRPTGADGSAAAIYAVVHAIPRGRVATYGQIAELAGIPNGHRIAARCMRECPEKLAWHRVVGTKDARRAQISVQDPDHATVQRKRLESEGVSFDHNGFISLRVSGWLPD